MSERITQVGHKGKRILVADFTSLTGEPALKLINELESAITSQQDHDLLFLLMLKYTKITPAIIVSYKHFSKRVSGYIWKDAVVGATKIQRILLDEIRRYAGILLPEFSSKEEAFEYLVSLE